MCSEQEKGKTIAGLRARVRKEVGERPKRGLVGPKILVEIADNIGVARPLCRKVVDDGC
jgi:hypothetical protein